MEAVFTRRYKINMLFSLLISLSAASAAGLASPYLFKNLFPGWPDIAGITAAAVFLVLHLAVTSKYRRRKKTASKPFPESWRGILSDRVLFYRLLDDDEKYYFEKRVQIFLSEKVVTGVGTVVDDESRVLIAAAAVIPVFKIEDWEYDTLTEILLYPDRFDEKYNFRSGDRDVLGMVVQHTATLIISKKDLFRGFSSATGENAAIHEFIHVIDEGDGEIDGLPALMLSKHELAEWKRIRKEEMVRLEAGESPLDGYALTEDAEFLAVAAEYYFNRPEKLRERSPELYNILKKIFKQDTALLLKEEALRIFRMRKK